MSVCTWHPLRGSEDELTYTEAQRDTIRHLADHADEVHHKLWPDGSAHVECVTYDEDDQQISCHVVLRDGLVF